MLFRSAIPAGGAASQLALEATATATTAPSGIALGPVTTSTTMPTVLPPSYPSFTPTSLAFPAIVGDGTSTATIVLTGSARGDTRACFGTSAVDGPQDAGKVTTSTADPCVEVPAGKTVSVELVLRAEHPADGRLQGTVPVTLTGVDAAQDITVDVPITSSMVRPVDEGKRWGLTSIFVLLAAILAYLVAHLGRSLADRYALGENAHVASLPVTVGATGVERRAGTGAVLPDVDDFRRFHGATRVAKFDVAGLRFGRSFSWVNPWAPATCSVRAEGGGIVVTNGRLAFANDARASSAPVRLPGTSQFYLVVEDGSPDASTFDARLVLLVDGTRGLAAPSAAWREALADYPSWSELVAVVT